MKTYRKPDKVQVMVFIFLIVMCLFYDFRGVWDASDNPAQETIYGPGWMITGQRGRRRVLPSQCEGTDEWIYCLFGSNVDAYDHEGNYCFTIEIYSDSQNGGVSIDCENNILAVQTKGNRVFLFRGTEQLDSMSLKEAKTLGYLFYEFQSGYDITRESVVKNVGDSKVPLFPLPPEIQKNLPLLDFGVEWAQFVNIVCVIVFVVFVFGFMGKVLYDVNRDIRQSGLH